MYDSKSFQELLSHVKKPDTSLHIEVTGDFVEVELDLGPNGPASGVIVTKYIGGYGYSYPSTFEECFLSVLKWLEANYTEDKE